MTTAQSDLVHVVDQQDRIVDHDTTHHDHTDVGLPGERRVGAHEDHEDADERHRDREKHGKRLPERLKQRGSDHIDENDGDREHQVDLVSLLTAPSPTLGRLHRITLGHGCGRQHLVPDHVPELARATKLVRHRALVLLVFAADARQDVALVHVHDVT